MPTPRKILTLHSPIKPSVVDDLLTSIEVSLRRAGATHVWIDPRSPYDLVVMAELPEMSCMLEGDAEVPDPRAFEADQPAAGIV